MTYEAQNILNADMLASCLYCQATLFRTWKLLRQHSSGIHLCCGFLAPMVPQLGLAPQGIISRLHPGESKLQAV